MSTPLPRPAHTARAQYTDWFIRLLAESVDGRLGGSVLVVMIAHDGTTEGEGVTRGNVAIADFVKGAVDPVVTVHHGHMPEIEILTPTTARGIWSMEDKLRWPEGSPIRSMHGYGHYHEEYKKVDGAWKISLNKLTRLRVDVEA